MKALPPPGTRVAIYARYSTDLQTFKSIEDQIALAREFAERHGWIVVGVFYDAERSGTTLIGRSGFFSMMAGADNGDFDLVLVEDLDRLSRNPADTHSIVEDLEAMEIDVCTLSSGIVDEQDVTIAALKNSQYVKGLAQKTRRGVEGTVRSGRISGSVAYGTRKVFSPEGVNGLRELHPDEAPIVKRIFTEYAAGVSTFAICAALNAEGVPPPSSKKGAAASIRKRWGPHALTGSKKSGNGILRNKLYIGQFHWGRTRKKGNRRKGKRTQTPTPSHQHIVIDVPHMRIVDDELFNAVQARLEERSLDNSRRSDDAVEAAKRFGQCRHPSYLFTGKAVCGVCGGNMQIMAGRFGCNDHRVNGPANRAKGLATRTEGCPNGRRVAREELEEAVLAGMKDRLIRPELIQPCFAEYRAEMQRVAAERRQKAESGQRRLKEVEQIHANALAHLLACTPGSPAAPALEREVARFEGELQQARRDVQQHVPELAHNLTPDAMVERLRDLIDDLRNALAGPEAQAVRARDLLRGMIDRIVVDPIKTEEQPDGRGAGPVRVTVEGSLSQMLELAEAHVGRVILGGSGPRTLLDDSTYRFSYYVDLQQEDPRFIGDAAADVQAIAGLLDPGDVPVTKSAMLTALANRQAAEDDDELERRLLNAMRYLQRRTLVRWIKIGGQATSGWVWDHYPFTDEQWVARATMLADHGQRPPHLLRVEPPEAFVVVISGPPPKPADDSGA